MNRQPAAASPLDKHAAPVGSSRGSGRATASLVLGIISVLACLIPIAAWIIGVIAIVLGATARSDARPGRGQATAGLVLGVIGILAGILVFAAVVSIRS
jgi:Domain of unknown function (DUF4190)